MKYIDRSKVAAPANLQGQAAPTSEADIKEGIYGHANVKKALTDLQKGICCYCESRYDVTGYGEVEHFRPKGGWQQDENDKEIHHPGYYWLAYSWENMMYACKRCNVGYKQNYFPLEDPSKRFNSRTLSIAQEKPLLINPYEEKNPENHLDFKGANILAKTAQGVASIRYYGLDRELLNEDRRQVLNPINALAETLEMFRGTDKEVDVENKLRKIVNETIKSGQYTLMIKCNFKDYIDKE